VTNAPSDPASVFDELSIAAFEAADVNAEAFSHEAHLFIAWSYLQETDLLDSIRRYTAALRRLTKKLGVPGKYHETITWFFMIVIAERCRHDASSDWPTFKTDNPDLFSEARTLLSHYYTRARLACPLARQQFLLPDRLHPAHGGVTI